MASGIWHAGQRRHRQRKGNGFELAKHARHPCARCLAGAASCPVPDNQPCKSRCKVSQERRTIEASESHPPDSDNLGDPPHAVERDKEDRRIPPVRPVPPLSPASLQPRLVVLLAPVSASPSRRLAALVPALPDFGERDVAKLAVGGQRIWCVRCSRGGVDAGRSAEVGREGVGVGRGGMEEAREKHYDDDGQRREANCPQSKLYANPMSVCSHDCPPEFAALLTSAQDGKVSATVLNKRDGRGHALIVVSSRACVLPLPARAPRPARRPRPLCRGPPCPCR